MKALKHGKQRKRRGSAYASSGRSVAMAATLTLLAGFLSGNYISPAAAEPQKTENSSLFCGEGDNPSISFLSDPTFWFNSAAGLDAQYVGYSIQAPENLDLRDIWITVGGFTGGQVSLAPFQPAWQSVGDISSGQKASAFFLTRLANLRPSTVQQSHTVSVYSGNPNLQTGATLLCSGTNAFTAISEAGLETDNTITNVTVTPSEGAVSIGSSVKVTVQGNTGPVGAGAPNYPGFFSWTPTAKSSFSAGSWRLVDVKMVTVEENYRDTLYLEDARQVSGEYGVEYTFLAINTSPSPSALSPIAYVASGAGVYASGSAPSIIPQLPMVNNNLSVSTETNRSVLPNSGGSLTYTTRVNNNGNVESSVSGVFDVLPPGATYEPGTTQVDGKPAPDPVIRVVDGRENLIFADTNYVVPPDGTVSFRYAVNFPSGFGTWSNSATAAVSATRIDSTRITGDYIPASTLVTVAPPPPTLGTVTPTTVGRAPVTFVPSISGAGINYNSACFLSGTSCSSTRTIPGEGTYTVNQGGTVTFVAAVGYSGTTTPVAYRITDEYQQNSTTNISVNVSRPSPPTVSAVTTTTAFRTQAFVSPGMSPSADPSTACLVTGLSCSKRLTTNQGDWNVSATGGVTFTPGLQHTGPVSPVSYRVTDSYGRTASNTISVTVNPPSPIVVSVPNNTNVAYMQERHIQPNITSGAAGAFCLISGTSCVKNVTNTGGAWSVNEATGEITFTAARNFSGSTRITLRSRGAGNISTDTAVNVTVGTPPAPTIAGGGTNARVTGSFGSSLFFTTQLTSTAGVNQSLTRFQDPNDGQWKTTVTLPGQGNYSVNTSNGVVTFIPALEFVGTTTSLNLRVTNTSGQQTTGTVGVTINQPVAPTASNAQTRVPYGAVIYQFPNSVSGTAIQPNLARLLDPADGQWKTVVRISGEGTWQVFSYAGRVQFTPERRIFQGATSPITYRLEDKWGQRATAQLTAVVEAPALPIIPNTNVSFGYGEPAIFKPTVIGVEPQPSTARLRDPANNSWQTSVNITGQGVWSTTSSQGNVAFNGVATFSGATTPVRYRIADLFGRTGEANMSVAVAAPPPPVLSTSVQADVGHQAPNTTALLGWVSPAGVATNSARLLDPADGQWKTTVVVSGQGTWQVATSTGRVTFTGIRAFVGNTNPITYRVGSPVGVTAQGSIAFKVMPAQVPTVAPATTGTTLPGSQGSVQPVVTGTNINTSLTCFRLTREGTCTRSIGTGQGNWGITSAGRLSFTPADARWVGETNTVFYQVTDGFGRTATGEVKFWVGQRTFTYFPTPSSSTVTATMRDQISNFAINLTGIPDRAVVRVSATVPPNPTSSDLALASARADAIILELSKIGVLAIRSTNINGASVSEATGVRLVSSYDTGSLVVSYPRSSFSIGGNREQFAPIITGGFGDRTFSVSGTLPTGVSFNTANGTFTGPTGAQWSSTPTQLGFPSNVTVTATDNSGSVVVPITLTAVSPPSAPRDLVANPGNGSVSLLWGNPAQTGGSPILGYNVYFATSANGPWQQYLAGTTSRSVNLLGLTNGVQYWFRVAAVNVIGEGEPATTEPVYPATVPSEPRNLTATAGDSFVNLNWDVPSSDGGLPITGYTVYYSMEAGGPWTVYATSILNTSYKVENLINGVPYWFQVEANNNVGQGPAAETAESVTPARVPSDPLDLNAVPGNEMVAVSWNPPADDGGEPVTGYNVYYALSEDGPWTQVSDNVDVTIVNIASLTNGTPYWFKVEAVNKIGVGPAAITGAIPLTVPGAPEAFMGTPGNSEVILTWEQPNNDGGSPIIDYSVYYSTSPLGPWTLWGNPVAGFGATVTGLSNGSLYWFQVMANNEAGEGPAAQTVEGIQPGAAPSAPTSLEAEAGNSQVTLTWQPPESGDDIPVIGYTVYYATEESGPWTLYATGITNTGSTVLDLTNGSAYWFQVTATNFVGEGSPAFTLLPVVPAAPPSEPTNLTADAGNATVLLTWDAPAADGGYPVEGYNVYYATSAVGPWSEYVSNIQEDSTTVTGLENGTGYWFRVTAINQVGEGAPATTSEPVTPVAVPSAPTGLIGEASDEEVALSWEAPADDGGSPISEYTVYYSGAESGPWARYVEGITDTFANVTGLENGTAYWFQVTASNSTGESFPSAAAGPFTPATVPSAPVDIQATPGNGLVFLEWSQPSSDGGAAILGYGVYYALSPAGPWAEYASGIDVTSLLVEDLSNGTPYWFRVAAINSMGTGDFAETSESVTPQAIPSAPQNLSAIPGDSEVTLNWQPPLSDGGSPIANYTVYISDTEEGPWTVVFAGVQNTTATVTELINGTPYWFQVTATNSVGEGPGENSGQVIPAAPPSAPLDLTGSPSNQEVALTWNSPENDGGYPVEGYNVYYAEAPEGPWSAYSLGITVNTVTVADLTNGTEYWFKVTAFSQAGEGDAAITSSPLTPVAVPSAPLNPNTTAGNREVSLSWTQPTNDGGTGITGYTVSYSPSPDGPWTVFSDSISETSVAVTGLTNGEAYWFRIFASNSVGAGPAVTTEEPTIPATVPSVPQSLVAIPGNSKVILDWTPPADDGGYPIYGYTVYSSTSEEGPFEAYASDVTDTEILIPDLVNGTSYWFKVTATNFVGESIAAEVGPSVPSTLPSAPIDLTAVPGNAEVALTWDPPADDGGYPILGYETYYATSAEGPWLAFGQLVVETTNTVSGLTNGTEYWFRVNATTEVGSGPPATTSSAVIPATVPSAPRNFIGDPGNSQVLLTWEEPSDDGGYPVTGYTVYVGETETGPFTPYAFDIADTSIVVSELVNGTPYWFQVVANNMLGESQPALTGDQIPGTAPTAPLDFAATPGNAEVILAWLPPEDDGGYTVDGYNVYFSTSDSGPWTLNSTNIQDTTTTVGGLTNGVQYWFKVTASNKAGEGPGAVETAIPATVPGAPDSFTGFAGNGEAFLMWDAPIDDGGAPLTGYTLYYSDQGATGPWTEYSTGSFATAIIVEPLANETNYWFKVTATNLVGTGPDAILGPLTPTSVPSEPVDLTASPSDSEVSLTWQPPADDGGSPITGYIVSYSFTENGPWETAATGVTSLDYKITNLTNGTDYWFRVEAVTARGTGAPALANAVPVGPPTAPWDVILTPGNTQIEVYWPIPENDGGYPITGYDVYKATSETGPWDAVILGTENTEITATGLSNGTSYWFKVTASNQIGTSPATVGGPAVPRTIPSAPQNLSATAGDTQVDLTWTAPASDGGAPLTGYSVYSSISASGPWELYAAGIQDTSTTVYSLMNGTSYWFRVTASNEAGESTATTVGPRTPVAISTAPRNLTAVPGDAQVALSWSPPSDPGTYPVTSYNVYRSTGSGSGPWTFVSSTSNTSLSLTGLTNGTSYWFAVRAVTLAGESNDATVGPAVPKTRPSAPQSLSLAPDNGQVTVSWTPPANNGGATITGYNVYRSTSSSSGPWTLAASNVPCCSRTITGLTNGTSYWFQVTAMNEVGEGIGASAGPAAPFVPSRAPSAPQSLTANPGNGQVSLSWGAPSDQGTSPVTSYNVYRSTSSSAGPWAFVSSITATSTNISGLTNGTSYWFMITAVNAVGESPGAVVGPTAPRTTPSAPQNISTAAGNGQVTVSWSAPSSNGGAAITGYNVYYSTSSGGPWTFYASGVACCSRVVSPLTNGTAYWFRVTAVNAAGEGTAATTATSTTPGPPATPSPSWTSTTSSSVTVTWSAVAGATSYTCSSTTGTPSLSGTSCTVSGLPADTAVTVSVAACNASCSSSASVSAASNPIVPSSVSWTYNGQSGDGGNRSATINWSGGTAGTYYVLANSSLIASSSSTSYTFTSAAASTSYTFAVRVINRVSLAVVGTANAAGTLTSITTPTGLSPRAGKGYESPLSVPISVTWGSTSGATSYRLFREGVVWFWTVGGTSYADSGLAWNTTYRYQVMACGSYGCSAWSSWVSERTAPAPALWSISRSGTSATVNIAAIPSGAAAVRIKWCDRTAVSGCDPDNAATGQSVWFTTAGAKNVSGLTSGRRYAFTVISARGSAGEGPQTVSATQAVS